MTRDEFIQSVSRTCYATAEVSRKLYAAICVYHLSPPEANYLIRRASEALEEANVNMAKVIAGMGNAEEPLEPL